MGVRFRLQRRFHGKCLQKRPGECSALELEAFEGLVKKGGEVAHAGLRERIKRAEWLVFLVEDDGTLAAVAALKRPNNSYKTRVFEKAQSPEDPGQFALEAGWIFVEPEFRGKRYSRLLLEAVTTLAGRENVYATTREDNDRMRRTNLHCGFVQSGSHYLSDEGNYKLVLYARRSTG